MMRQKKYGFFFLLLLLTWQMRAQEPFTCAGSFYLTLSNFGTESTAYEVIVDPVGGDIQFSPLNATTTGATLNAVGFRSTDNFIYGIDPGNIDLYKLDATGTAFLVAKIGQGIDKNKWHIAGDITPDGRYLVIVEAGNQGDEALIFVDLESPNFEKTRLELSGQLVRCADIAFDPITGRLYGFDGRNSRLVEYNLQTGLISSGFPSSNVAEMMGAIFFDAFGDLYGYGRRTVVNTTTQDGFFKIDKNTGEVELLAIGPGAGGNDGCSCPYRIDLKEWIAISESVVPCTVVPIQIEFANTSGKAQTGLTFEHYFPPEITIDAIDFPFGVMPSAGGPGTDFLVYENLTIPTGIFEMTIWVELSPASSGTHALQSSLSGLPTELGEVVISDNPLTLHENDPAILTVEPLEIDFSMVNTHICPGDALVLSPGIFGVDYLWSDGSTAPEFTVTEGGTYGVTVSSGCDVQVETINVQVIPLDVFLKPYLEVELGDAVSLIPFLFPAGGEYDWSWSAESDVGALSCLTCPQPSVRPLFDDRFTVRVFNDQGCEDTASVFVKVLKNRRVYFPNAFSPNGDGFNDFFFPATKTPEIVRSFQVFDRWGNLVFERSNFRTNEVEAGWTGFAGKKPLPVGVYVYKAEIEFLDGETRTFSGDITLLR
ncbi:MAG: gliding motility-associated C-terminal domain-containing protein [Bacteroidetes bacterium]|nr:MAG: gliding motility-associated C-terminal domain-containing protein [Bacteroidota bacterium]